MLHLIFSSLLDHSLWIKYNLQWNANVIINEATRERALLSMKQQENIYRTDKFLTQDHSCLKALWALSLCLCQNSNIRVLEEVFPLHFLRNIWQANIFFLISLVSHGIALAKHMVKQGKVVFFPSDKKIDNWQNYWDNTRIRSSTWIKVGCRKRYIIRQRELYIEIY